MANKNFEVKHGLSVGGTERITSAGVGSFPSLSTSGNLTVGGDLTVTGSTITADNLVSADKNITLNYHASNDTSGSADGAGITIQDAVDASNDATITWSASNDRFDFSHKINVSGTIDSTGDLTVSKSNPVINIARTGNWSYKIGSLANDTFVIQSNETSDASYAPLIEIDSYAHQGTGPALKIDNSGKVGIGTASPNGLLHIGDSSAEGSQSAPALQIGSTTNYRLGMYTTTEGAFIENKNGDDGINFLVKTAGQAMRIDGGTGYVGIGTTNPTTDLHLYSTADSRPHILLESYQNHDTDDAPRLEFYANDSTTGGIADSTYVGEIIFSGDEKDSNSKEIYGKIRGMAFDPGSGTSNKGSIELWSQVGGTLQRVLNARQIQSSGATGAVGINEVNPAYTFDINTTGESNALRLYQGTSSGKDLSMLMQNAGTGSGDDCLISLYTAAGAGDAKIRWAISGNETWEMGIDNDNSDALKISNGSSLGTDDRMRMAGSTVAWTTTNFTIQNAGDPTVLLTNTNASQTLRFDHNSIRTTTNHNLSLLVNSSGNRKLMLKTSSTNDAKDLIGIGGVSSPGATLHIQNLNSENNSNDAILYIAKNSGNDWSAIFGSGSDNYGIKVVGYGANAFVAADHNQSSAYRARISHDGLIYSSNGSISDIDSDERLKEEITDAPSQWQMIKDLPLQKFKWIDRRMGDVDSYGWIAQAVEENYPEFVEDVPQTKEDIDAGITTDFKTVKTGDIQRRSIAALQEAMTRIETLEAQVTQNLSDINLLKSRIEVLEG